MRSDSQFSTFVSRWARLRALTWRRSPACPRPRAALVLQAASGSGVPAGGGLCGGQPCGVVPENLGVSGRVEVPCRGDELARANKPRAPLPRGSRCVRETGLGFGAGGAKSAESRRGQICRKRRLDPTVHPSTRWRMCPSACDRPFTYPSRWRVLSVWPERRGRVRGTSSGQGDPWRGPGRK